MLMVLCFFGWKTPLNILVSLCFQALPRDRLFATVELLDCGVFFKFYNRGNGTNFLNIHSNLYY